MIGLEQWRARIGCFCPKQKRVVLAQKLYLSRGAVSITLKIVLALSLCLILANDVETNPGPVGDKGSITTRQSKLNFPQSEPTLSDVMKSLDNVRSSIQSLTDDVKEVKNTIAFIQENTQQLQNQISDLTCEVSSLKKTMMF